MFPNAKPKIDPDNVSLTAICISDRQLTITSHLQQCVFRRWADKFCLDGQQEWPMVQCHVHNLLVNHSRMSWASLDTHCATLAKTYLFSWSTGTFYKWWKMYYRNAVQISCTFTHNYRTRTFLFSLRNVSVLCQITVHIHSIY